MKQIKGANKQELNYMRIYCCGTEKVKKSCVYGPTIRSHHLIHYVLSGKGRIHIYGRWHECQAGSIIWIPPHNPVTYIADNINPWHYAWIGIAGGESDILCDELKFSPLNPTRKYETNSLEGLFVEIKNVYQVNGDVARLKALSVFYKIVNEISDFNDIERIATDKLLENALKMIRDNYWKKPKIEELALELGVDRSYLYKIFKKELGISPKKMIDDYRLAVAYELLRSGNSSVNQISKKMGYGSATTFSKIFKDKYGISPSEHMKKQRKIR